MGHPVGLSRFVSGQVLMLGVLSFESHGVFPAQGRVSAAWIRVAVDVFEGGDVNLLSGLKVSTPDQFGPLGI